MTTVYKNGNIYTMDACNSKARAIVVKDTKIVYIGEDKGIEKWLADADEVTDLQGRTVLPGLIEGHTHLDKLGEVSMQIDDYIAAIHDYMRLFL